MGRFLAITVFVIWLAIVCVIIGTSISDGVLLRAPSISHLHLLFLIAITIVFTYCIVAYCRFEIYRSIIHRQSNNLERFVHEKQKAMPLVLQLFSQLVKHESNLTRRVTTVCATLNHAHSVFEKNELNNELSAAIKSLDTVLEEHVSDDSNPEFAETHAQLRTQVQNIETIENEISNARRKYNDAVHKYRILSKAFPANYVSRVSGFHKIQYHQLA
ncbi:MAG TPA: LemA family protein [Acidobacteriota bacterium]|nr:LemA family protein [Acidobacteriota bacterium]